METVNAVILRIAAIYIFFNGQPKFIYNTNNHYHLLIMKLSV